MDKKYSVRGMVCSNCSVAIEKKLASHNYVNKATVSYKDRKVSVEFCEGKELSMDELNALITSMGYEIINNDKKQYRLTVVGIALIVLFLLLNQKLGISINPEIGESMTYTMLFLAGVLTSFHCIAMCGGIAMTQSIHNSNKKHENLNRVMKYNVGRVVSYTLLGGVIGSIGSVVTIGGSFRGAVSIMAGVFMLILSMNLLGIIKINLPKFKRRSRMFSKSNSGPFLVGLANGFMPCGPLQTMQLYALGTGTILGGMSSMFFFSLGTVPMMLGFGLFTGVLSKNGGRRFIKASSVMVCILGLVMINRGLLLSGYGVSVNTKSLLESSGQIENSFAESNDERSRSTEKATNIEVVEEIKEDVEPYRIIDGVQVVQMSIMSDRYELSSPLVVGIPARIELDIQGINRCNSPVLIPKAGVEVDLLRNEPIMEFTPDAVGDLKVTCWMGMITTNISVVESLSD